MDTVISETFTTSGPPRLTTYLRHYSKLCKSIKDRTEFNYSKILALKREEKRKQMREHGASWQNVKKAINLRGQQNGLNLNCYFKEIDEIARLVAPEADTRNEIAILLFNVCFAHKVLTVAGRSKISHVVGEVKNSLIDRAHKASYNITELIGNDEITDIMSNLKNSTSNQKMFGQNIKVGSVSQKPHLPSHQSLLYLVKEKQNAKNSFNFEDYPIAQFDGKNQSPNSKVESFDVSWVEAEMCKAYKDTSMIPELAKGTVTLLTGSKSDDELQNELFDFLGFDRFELIQSLLSRRDKIKVATSGGKKHHINMASLQDKIDLRADQPSFASSVTVMSRSEKNYLKLARKEEKRMLKTDAKNPEEEKVFVYNPAELRAQREQALMEATLIGLSQQSERSAPRVIAPKFPYVFDGAVDAKQTAGFIAGNKVVLPIGFKRIWDERTEEVQIPECSAAPTDVGSKLIPISDLDKVGQLAFSGCKTLNRIQTVVHPVAYHSNENLLICAPTGAGKTNIAMLTVIHQVRQYMEEGVIQKDKFKVVYIAPMKALAAEMARNFGKRLEPLGLIVRELTGDMHLTKPEIMATNMIITTPEKWDVTTRKPGDTQLAQLVKLLIIDEVHLLHGDRGPVLETLVARTLRMVETQQSMIRIVGLSATLPNYIDIANFLHVNPYKGLFYFDSRFRPVPLGLTFVGVKALNRLQQMEQMDTVAYDKCHDYVMKGKQVMIFVHARNGTLKTANNLIRIAQDRGHTQDFAADSQPDVERARKELSRSRNKKLVELFGYGFGVHHAGLLRQDRTLIERAFAGGFINVLVTTATLAWGVNLPAHAVIIKGTDLYDSKHGTFIDLGILDVLQIFGRAGRPQFDKTGHGIIITTQDKLAKYLSLLTNQYPIESSFITHLVDNLNAEVALGTVTNITEAVEWLSYTYLYVRLRKNPQAYGLKYADAQNDPNLEMQRREYIVDAAKSLDKAMMIRYDQSNGYLHITDLGRIASQFYVKYDSVEIFNQLLKTTMNETDILSLTSQASEFQQLKVRDEEMNELDYLHGMCEVQPKGGPENIHGKVNILLQSYISRVPVDGFSLISDMSYISDNSVRISRALFEIVLHRGWASIASKFLKISKSLERRLWYHMSPLRQFPQLSHEVLTKIDNQRLNVDILRDMSPTEIGRLIRHDKMGKVVKECAEQFPNLELEATVQPITRTVLRVRLDVTPDFRWNDKVHGKQEIYWIWVEDPINNHMYHQEEFKLNKKQVMYGEPQQLVFTIPLFEPLPSQYYVRAISDKWIGCETACAINFTNIVLPEMYPPHTPLLDLDPLPVTALGDARLEMLYRFSHFNPIQTQLFHCLYHTNANVLLGAPTGSGKTIAAELAMFKVFRDQPKTKVVYIAPLKALVRERVKDWRVRLGENLKKNVIELTGDVTPDIKAIQAAHVIITTPEKWDGISRSWQTRSYVKEVSLIIIDEIHLLGEDRGPVLEVIISRTNFISSHTSNKLRVVGLSTALANAIDLANWLGIGQMGLYNFRASVRPVPLEVHISGFPGKHYCPRMATMNKPTFQSIKQYSPEKPVLVFVSSRRQTRLTALDLMSFIVTEANPKQWLHMPDHEMDQILENIKEENLRLCLSFGIGLHHAGLIEKDRKVVEELFVNQKIQILIATSTLAWGVNFPAHLVVVKGTEYFDGKTKRYVDFPITDVLQMMGRAGRPQFDNQGVAVIMVQDQKKHFYKKFLYEPFPVESSLLKVLPDHLNAEVVAGTINSKQEALDYLTWTYFFRRLSQNPTYYGLDMEEQNTLNNNTNLFLTNIIEKAIGTLQDSSCIVVGDDDRALECTPLGKIASFYYLSHQTMSIFEEKLHANITLQELLKLLTDVHEYAELPVRHNEDNLNAELAQKCPIKVDSHTFDSSHTKAHLLLQSHMSHLQLPCVDYYTDLKSVLDQAIRILQAMIDVCSYAGWLAASLQVQVLMQMISQARWHSDPSVLCLPYVDCDLLHCFRSSTKQLDCLPELIEAVGDNYQMFAKMLRNDLEEGRIETAYKVMRQFPLVNVSASLFGRWADQDTNSLPIILTGKKNNDFLPVHASEEYSLSVRLHKYNKDSPSQKAHAPKFPKPKDECWFLVLGERNCGELLALKRVSRIKGRSMQSLCFTAPRKPGKSVLTLYLMSDTYLGFDQQFDIKLDILPAFPQDISTSEDSVQSIEEKKWIPPIAKPEMVASSSTFQNAQPDQPKSKNRSRKNK